MPQLENQTNNLQQDLLEFETGFAEHYQSSQDSVAIEDLDSELEQASKDQDRGFVDKAVNFAGDVAGSVASGAIAVTKDVARSVPQLPRAGLRGAFNAVKSVVDITDKINDALGSPEIQITNEKGEFDLDIVSQETIRKKIAEIEEKTGKKVQDNLLARGVPVIDKPKNETVTGNIVEAMAQFAVGNLVGGKILGSISKGAGLSIPASRAGNVAKDVIKGSLADVIAFNEQEERLSNIIQQQPALKNPVTEYLAADNDDTFVEAKLKQAIEGMALGGLGNAFFESVRLVKQGRKLEDSGVDFGDITDPGIEIDEQVLNREKINVLGDIDSDALILKRVNKAQADDVSRIEGKLDKAVKDTASISAKSVDDAATKEIATSPEIEINFARIEGPDDIPKLMQEMANDPDLIASVKAARRGVQSDEALLKSADDVDGFKELLNRRTGEGFNSEQTNSYTESLL